MENYLLLVRSAKSGDAKAFAKLYETVYEDMYRFALYLLKNPEDAKDVVSDAVVDAFATIGNLRAEEAFRGWIFKILSNKCRRMLDTYRKRDGELTEELLETGGNLDGRLGQMGDDGLDMAESAVIRSLFFSLTEEERTILSLHLFGGYTGREISQMLGMNENTLRSKESRALKKLAKQMD